MYFSVVFIVTHLPPVLLLFPLHSFLFSVFLKIFSSIEMYFSFFVIRFSILCEKRAVYEPYLPSSSSGYPYHYTAFIRQNFVKRCTHARINRGRCLLHRGRKRAPVRAYRRVPHRSCGSIRGRRRPSLRWMRASRLRCMQTACV